MKEAPVRSFYFIQHQYGVISRMEDFAARRALVAPAQENKKEAVRRARGQYRLAAKLTERVQPDVVVAAGLALIAARYPGDAPEPYRINAGLVLLGSEQATAYLAGQSDLFYQTLKTYQTVILSQQPQSQAHVPLKFLPALDPVFDNELRIAVNLRLLRDAVKGDNQKFQAVERVLRG